jgi:EmrB/QacA subfamily drug resistance transporter
MGDKRWLLAAAILGSGIVFLDSTVITVALPRIGQTLPAGPLGVLEGQSYVYYGYLLTLSSLLILAGALNDAFGRRRMFAIGLTAFGATSVLCGFAPTMEALIAARVLQGAAGAMLVPGSLSLITAMFQGEEQGRAFGVWAGASGVTSILGPVIGGLLVDLVSWRAIFLINVPLIVLALWATLRHVPESYGTRGAATFDWTGALVGTVAVGGLTFGPIYGQQRSWHDPLAYKALAVGAVAALAFPWLMARKRHPLVPLSLFRSRNFSVTNASTLVIYGALYIALYYILLFIQGTLRYSAAGAGLAIDPATIFLVLFSSRIGVIARRYGPRWFMAVGPTIMAVGLLYLARVPSSSAAWIVTPGVAASYLPPPDYLAHFFPGFCLFGIGLAVMVTPLTTCVMTSVPVGNAGLASAINNAVSRIGPQLAGAVIFAVITASFYGDLAQRLTGLDPFSPVVRAKIAPLNRPAADVTPEQTAAAREASTNAFHRAMMLAAGMLLAGAAINAVGIRNPEGARDGRR